MYLLVYVISTGFMNNQGDLFKKLDTARGRHINKRLGVFFDVV